MLVGTIMHQCENYDLFLSSQQTQQTVLSAGFVQHPSITAIVLLFMLGIIPLALSIIIAAFHIIPIIKGTWVHNN
jgi:hypothetical protein